MSEGFQPGSKEFRLASIGLFVGGFVTFSILYSTQAILPTFSREFGVSPAVASLSLSFSTGALAVCLVLFGSCSEAWGRKRMMSLSLLLSSVIVVATALVPDFRSLLVLRMLEGAALAGLPSVAMAYLAEEMSLESLGLIMGLYISGNSIGGMSGRIISGLLTDWVSWRAAMAVLGSVGLLGAIWFAATLPASRNFERSPLSLRPLAVSLFGHLRDPGLLCLFGLAFSLMGAFVTLYNYVGYHLMQSPFNLSQAAVGLIFLNYLFGATSSTWMGRMADRYGRRRVLWTALAAMATGALVTLVPSWATVLGGVALYTFGFFGGHSIASSWVGKRARTARAQAASLYLLFYYLGSSIGGTVGGFLWSAWRWPGVISLVGGLLCLGALLALKLSFLPPVHAAAPLPQRGQ